MLPPNQTLLLFHPVQKLPSPGSILVLSKQNLLAPPFHVSTSFYHYYYVRLTIHKLLINTIMGVNVNILVLHLGCVCVFPITL